MSALLLYFVLLKATLSSFTGLASLPMIRGDLVLDRGVLTDEQLNTAIVVSRATPGPAGIYVVSVGYSVAGIAGAFAGWAALCTPAFLVLPFAHAASGHIGHRRMQGAVRAVIATGAGILLASVGPMADHSLDTALSVSIAVGGTAMMLRGIRPVWLVIMAAGLGAVVSVAVR